MQVRRRFAVGVGVMALLACCGCATLPPAPAAVGEGFPGTCLPGELTWPTDFLESLPSESDAVGGRIVGLRLEYIDSAWVWRLRSADTRYDVFGEAKSDPGFGRESIVDVRTLEQQSSGEVQLTEAEQQDSGTGALAAALQSGERWPSPLIIEMARVMDGGNAVWRVTTCDTQTGEHTVLTLP